MRRGLVLAAGWAALLATGCQSWQDRADTRALEACEKLSEAEARARCRQTVIETERARQQKAMEQLELQIRESKNASG